ncbi:bifunctional diguanylate cyclase/phosphodiesterase [soil metagenome]
MDFHRLGIVLFSPLGVLGLVLALLAALVAIDWVERVQISHRRVGLRWLAGAAVALGTGIVSAHLVFMAAAAPPFALGYHPWIMLAAWAIAVVLGAVGLGFGCASAGATPLLRLLVGAVCLASGTVATQVMCLEATGLRPGLLWSAEVLGAAWVASACFCGGGLWMFSRARMRVRKPSVHVQPIAAVLLALAVVGSQFLVIAAANLSAQSLSGFELRLPADTLLLAASLGSVALLATMLISSLLEAQMRASLQHAKGELHKRTLTDPLTDLPNRPMFESAMAQAVIEADANRGRVALLFIDLDGFKPVNESFGYQMGDRVLCEVAQRLRAITRPQDMVARLGADEFLMLLVDDPEADEAARVASRVLASVGELLRINGRETSLSCSIGLANYPEHGPAPGLIACAEAAMRNAKAAGGATFCVFEKRMTSGAREQFDLLRDLRGALAKGQLELYYQPKVRAETGEATGVEALMRWHHPQRGMVSPAVFVPIAERYGLISALGNWVIDEACRQMREWNDAGLRMRVAINLSVHQLRHPDLGERIEAALRTQGVTPSLLTCEITESVAMDDPDGTMKMFEKLAAVGVKISIDDFGTGYSSLSYLRKLPASELKIDRGFVLDLETSSDARAVVDAVIKLAQALGLKVVAEGVETEGQRVILRSLGCEELQGYLFAKPMSAKFLGLWAAGNAQPRRTEFREARHIEVRRSPVH